MTDTVHIGGVPIGPGHFTIIAGPCAVESHEMALRTALDVRAAGVRLLRAGVFKPRTSPHSFQGLGSRGLEILRDVKAETGLPVVTELMDVRRLDEILDVADAVQVGARNMQNYPILTELGRLDVPVLLKRGISATIDELLLAAEYIRCQGNNQVILCERGIRTFETAYRFTLDVAAVAVLRERTGLPVIVDPSHAAGRRERVLPLSLAAVGAGADGLIVEVHPAPNEAKCDGEQALRTDHLNPYVERIGTLAGAMGRGVGSASVARTWTPEARFHGPSRAEGASAAASVHALAGRTLANGFGGHALPIADSARPRNGVRLNARIGGRDSLDDAGGLQGPASQCGYGDIRLA